MFYFLPVLANTHIYCHAATATLKEEAFRHRIRLTCCEDFARFSRLSGAECYHIIYVLFSLSYEDFEYATSYILSIPSHI